MKKVILALLVLVASFSMASARINSTEIAVDYNDIVAGDYVLELAPDMKYLVTINNVPDTVDRTKLKKAFRGRGPSISGRPSDLDDGFVHRINTRRGSFEGKIKLNTFEQVASDDDSGDDDSTLKARKGADDGAGHDHAEDYQLLESLEFTVSY
ncbi:MAG: hypothetical protein LW817_08635 [Candidatus Caenarcaniphilales bacterium]|jgi:hypothetical protein|nr:hypothetical protein [Candidatus Caenarcaniphilales bacterium]